MKISKTTIAILGGLILLAGLLWFAILWQQEKKLSKAKDTVIDVMTIEAKESERNAIRKAKVDSLRLYNQFDSLKSYSVENSKQLLHDISKTKFPNNAARKHYADSLQRAIGR